jgi:hypothetical protein
MGGMHGLAAEGGRRILISYPSKYGEPEPPLTIPPSRSNDRCVAGWDQNKSVEAKLLHYGIDDTFA